ncbi:MAG: DUF4921 family protein [Micropruina glycogenica]
MLTSHREPDWLTMMADGTVKQLNPFSGTEVWTKWPGAATGRWV